MIWATISSRSCFCWLYRASPSLAAKNIINLISVLTIWWCPCAESSLVLLEEGVCYQCVLFIMCISPVRRSVVSNTLRPHESQHTRSPCPSPAPEVYSNSYPSSRQCHPTISSSAVSFFSCPQSLPASGSFVMSQLFAWGGQSTGVSALASVLPMNIQDWSPSK